MTEQSTLVPFEAYLDKNLEVLPLARVFIEQIFCSRLDTKEKLDLIWDTMIFFEQSDRQQSDIAGFVSVETCRYLVNFLALKLCPSIPLNAANNCLDLITCGDSPTIKKAFLI